MARYGQASHHPPDHPKRSRIHDPALHTRRPYQGMGQSSPGLPGVEVNGKRGSSLGNQGQVGCREGVGETSLRRTWLQNPSPYAGVEVTHDSKNSTVQGEAAESLEGRREQGREEHSTFHHGTTERRGCSHTCWSPLPETGSDLSRAKSTPP